MKRLSLVLAALSFLVLAGCSTTGDVATETVEDEAPRQEVETTDTEARAVEDTEALEGDPLDDPSSPLANRVVYFAFDSSELSSDDIALLEAHARHLANNPDLRVVVEGHTDERGSKEYNLALGERRANAAVRILTLNGVGQNQVESVSFGEEEPVALGSNEEAWAQNRRAELVYSNR
ncbi:peptidoglycan-associated lipoprotein [Alkalilimnicola ehrlichii]|uniref:Peptidoglycan-associated lipoprotein n=1 Tax=Alkalilimnicola ehrlichii TaxID=351052 RepID=A0A3E0X191_9GAMM|nr:peptidoglycan-associated lipoprotein Pal [Alkalilimnicola ehrlichii]RFA31344.1 peptidoglycan-associated lipoprotein [Alkalilimnicola ehrlichii]RFA39381.1 peptidoglycan-associated lipoprotein [Alkalilimnicola ehrlichii]